jgi:lipopolysaccharide transport system ATP-binding protein
MSLVISVENVSKTYRLGDIGGRMLREDVARWWAKLRDKPAPPLEIIGEHHARQVGDQFLALDNVSFEVQQGEVLGIIGRNGAGKSTLLKILSQVTLPSSGRIRIKGRIASLLEVGTGFHPDLSGRENVFLNGAILGMTRAEIRQKFDSIVSFSEIEEFIDTPVKRYSSGMYVRLAFAVAAHLEPEILIVDEVLAVGDASFQKKCLGKMGQVSHEGRTILFVSHNAAAIKALCSKAVLLTNGAVTALGGVSDVTALYSSGTASAGSTREWRDPGSAPGNESIRLSYVRIIPPEGTETITIDTGASIEIGFDNLRKDVNLDCTVYLVSGDGVLIFESGHIISSNCDSRCGFYHVTGRIPGHLLNAGHYSLSVVFGKDQRYALFRIDEVVSFDIENTLTGRGLNMGVTPGFIRPLLSWRHSFEETGSFVNYLPQPE